MVVRGDNPEKSFSATPFDQYIAQKAEI